MSVPFYHYIFLLHYRLFVIYFFLFTAVNHEPPVYYSSSTQHSQGLQYNTEYSAPPPTYDDVTDPGKVNFGFRSPT